MSMFGDYKAYKKFEPGYASWKLNRDLNEAKRLEYLRQNPSEINPQDIQRGRTLIRAIDIMDEYSQKRAENMEVATQSVVAGGIELAMFGGAGLGFLAGRLKPVQKLIGHFLKGKKNANILAQVIPALAGALAGITAVFPLQAWAAKAEVSASRKGRFAAMRNELKNPKGFAVLTEEQMREAEKLAANMVLDDKKPAKVFSKNLKNLKDMTIDSKEYLRHKREFELALLEDEMHLNDNMTPQEIENAKKDQQLLTTLVEKIDIASQDYAENAELSAGALTSIILGCGALFDLGLQKILNACKVKLAGVISAATKVFTVFAGLTCAIMTAQIAKQASRVGRFKIKQELMKHPEQLVYVDNDKANSVGDVKPVQNKKQGIIEFLKTAWKNNKEYNNYKKNQAAAEKKFYQAIEKLELTPEQMKDAKRLQKNAFKTFNKVDENSQKYSESVEAFGQSVAYPLNLIFSSIGVAIGAPLLMKKTKSGIETMENFAKYMLVVLLSSIPSIGINAFITREQKKASRVADMLAINEMSDYRWFR